MFKNKSNVCLQQLRKIATTYHLWEHLHKARSRLRVLGQLWTLCRWVVTQTWTKALPAPLGHLLFCWILCLKANKQKKPTTKETKNHHTHPQKNPQPPQHSTPKPQTWNPLGLLKSGVVLFFFLRIRCCYTFQQFISRNAFHTNRMKVHTTWTFRYLSFKEESGSPWSDTWFLSVRSALWKMALSWITQSRILRI